MVRLDAESSLLFLCAQYKVKIDFVISMTDRFAGRENSSRYLCRVIPQTLLCVVLLTGSIIIWAQSDALNTQFAQATQAMQQGNLDVAAAGFAAIAKQSPTFAEAHFNLGLVREEQVE